jgi:hypothetical protein
MVDVRMVDVGWVSQFFVDGSLSANESLRWH